jgi:hypothetical protein
LNIFNFFCFNAINSAFFWGGKYLKGTLSKFLKLSSKKQNNDKRYFDKKKWFQSIPLYHWITGQFIFVWLPCYIFSFLWYFWKKEAGGKNNHLPPFFREVAVLNLFTSVYYIILTCTSQNNIKPKIFLYFYPFFKNRIGGVMVSVLAFECGRSWVPSSVVDRACLRVW